MPPQSETAEYLTPLVIGVTGHRDIVASEVDALRRLTGDFFSELQQRFPNSPLHMMTALAEGADRLATQVAIERDIEVQAVLPMPMDVYRNDFSSAESRAEFDALCAHAEIYELPMSAAQQLATQAPGPDRDLLYANAGMFISAHCHILLAFWDGVQSENVGGTSQIIYFQHYDRLPGVAESVPRTSLFLTDDESDLVYHISCSRIRNRDNGNGMRPLQVSWYTTDPDAPRLEEMPIRYVSVFARADEYNLDICRYLLRHGEVASAEEAPPETVTKAAALRISKFLDIADVLANYFQGQVDRTLAAIFALAMLTGLSFILYSELGRSNSLIFVFLASLLISLTIARIARRRKWHRKYLDYRVLAEGLRVQYFWAIAGIHGEGHTKFAYDNFLRQRDMELGWIRNVMRVAGTLSDSQPRAADKMGLDFSIEHWIGTEEQAGQFDYYRDKAAARTKANRLTDAITLACLWSGLAVAALLAFYISELSPVAQDYLIIMMGVLPLLAGLADVYTQRRADKELTRQYEFMEHVFANARRRLAEAANDAEKREVLQGLGDAALSEHAEWILVHRVRQPEAGGL